MGVARGANGEFLQPRIQALQFGLCLPHGFVKRSLVTPVQRREVHRLDRRIQLAFSLGLSLGKRSDHRPGSEDFGPEQRGIWAAVGSFESQLAAINSGIRFRAAHAHGNQEFLPWLRAFRERNRLLHVLVRAGHK